MHSETPELDATVIALLCGSHGLGVGLFYFASSPSPIDSIGFHASFWPWVIWWSLYWLGGFRASKPMLIFAVAGTLAWFAVLPGMLFIAALALGART